MDLRDHFERNIAARVLFRRGDSLLAAVSGGIDSMVLLDLLAGIAPKLQLTLAVAHFNHQLRGAEADGDEAFVAQAAARLQLPFHSGRADVRAAAAARGVSIEMAGRELRHRFLAETAEAGGASQIVLAHHADDQVETFWLRLLRGQHGPGLPGMRWSRPARPRSIRLVRPLLDVPKSELIAYAGARAIEHREDASNFQADHQRNQLRLEVLPCLEKFQPALRPLTLRAIEILGAEKEYLATQARAWLDNPREPFAQLHAALQREAIRLQLVALGLPATYDLIESLRTLGGTGISAGPETFVRCENGKVNFALVAPPFSPDQLTLKLGASGTVTFQNLVIEWEMVTARGRSAPGTEYFDATEVGSEVTVRCWLPGDRFQPIGLGAAAKLQDLYTNQKVPAHAKRRRVVALDSKGRIFWAEGLRISECHKITESTGAVLRWNWRASA